MEANIKVQLDLNQRISRAKSNFRKSPKERLVSVAYINTRLEALEELWSKFSLSHIQLIQSSETKTLNATSYVTNNVYEATEELFIDYKFELKETLNKLNQNDQPDSSNNKNSSKDLDHNFKLPKISISPFSGKYDEWISFHDMFVSLVHKNKSLDDVQWLHYLKGLLHGEAEQLLRHVPVTASNYETCWEQLEKRYNNKKYLSNCILKRLMSQKHVTIESASALKGLLDTTNECLNALKNLCIDISTWDILVIYIVCQKLDNESRKQWELKTSEFSEELPSYKQFHDFLEARFRALEFIDLKWSRPNVTNNNVRNHKVFHTATLKCPYCTEDHRLANFKKFCKDETDTRRAFVQYQGLCFNCLGSGHSVFACRQNSRCRICKRKHHSLSFNSRKHSRNVTKLTDSTGNANQSVEQGVVAHAATSSSSSPDEFTKIITCFSAANCQVLLATALVNAQSKSGKGILRCLIDPGSQASFITESAVQLLRLKKLSHKSIITGLGSDEASSLMSKSMVVVQLQSLYDPNFTFKVHAFVLNRVTSILPERQIVVELWPELSNLNLADPLFHTPNKIDLLLGADVYGQILLDGIIKGPPGTPIAQRTSLGWILSGPVEVSKSNLPQNSLISMHISHVNEDDLLKRFWELEAVKFENDSNVCLSDEERKCEEIFKATTKRDVQGRYIVNLPFRSEDPICKYSNSKDIAVKRFLQLEKRLLQNPELKIQYSNVILEYKELGHMEEISPTQRDNPVAVYLPHHAIVRDDKTTTKVRVVFDASCLGSTGNSLNQDLLVGPTLQPDLRHILMRWRYYPICLVADIVKMYRQIKLDDKHTDFQRLVWRDNPDSELQHLKLLRVTFGTASAPYLAVRCLQQLAYDDGENYPMATERVLKEFYMDDLLTGCQSVEEGKLIYKQMNELLRRGGFDLQKWSTNNQALLKEINEDNNSLEGVCN